MEKVERMDDGWRGWTVVRGRNLVEESRDRSMGG